MERDDRNINQITLSIGSIGFDYNRHTQGFNPIGTSGILWDNLVRSRLHRGI